MKGQAWQLEFVVSVLLVTIAFGIFFQYSSSVLTRDDSSITDISIEAGKLSEFLMSSGIPQYWNDSNVKQIGLTDNNWRFNETKIISFFTLSESDIRIRLGTQRHFYVQIFENSVPLIFNSKNYVGDIPTNNNQLVSVSRYGVYDGNIVELRVIIWE